jgi:predicted dinucleotide-binding enzyme
MKIAFLGYGNVGAPLAHHLQKLGHDVTLAAHDPHSDHVKKALNLNTNLKVNSTKDAVKAADVVFLATPFTTIRSVLEDIKHELTGKILIDCTNPIGPNFTHALSSLQSASELIQNLLPDTKVLKAFNIYGFKNYEDNKFPAYDIKPVMMYCGDDTAAKKVVGGLIAELGWEPLDIGGIKQALHLEHMCLLWVSMVFQNGRSPHTVWALLTR